MCQSQQSDQAWSRLQTEFWKARSASITIQQLTFASEATLPEFLEELAFGMQKRNYFLDKASLSTWIEREVRKQCDHRGYLKASIGNSEIEVVEESGPDQTVVVTLEVEPGTQYRLGTIHFSGGTQFDDVVLQSLMAMKGGEIVDMEQVWDGIHRLRQAYDERGFIKLKAIPHLTINEADASVSLLVELDEGKQFTIGMVDIKGLDAGLARTLAGDPSLKLGNTFQQNWEPAFYERNGALLIREGVSHADVQCVVNKEAGLVNLKLDFRSSF